MRRLLLLASLVALVAIAAAVWLSFAVTPRVRGELATFLAERYGQDVRIGSVGWRLLPRFSIRGTAVEVRREPGASGAPLLAIGRFEVGADLRDLVRSSPRIRQVTLTGLRITLEPGRAATETGGGASPAEGPAAQAATRPAEDRGSPPRSSGASRFSIDEVIATDARLELGSSRPDKPPRVFVIPRLRLSHITTTGPVDFEAAVVNPTPPGQVEARGTFGPWNRDRPSHTPISGTYTFADARLDAIKGLGGVLASHGTFNGALDDIHVAGDADVPDFGLDTGQAAPLRVGFDARISERGGDVELPRVNSSFGATTLETSGAIVRSPEERGRRIELYVKDYSARIEDVLRLAMKASPPPITGPLELDAAILIPPGEERVIRKLGAQGTFRLPSARFTSTNVQGTLEKISRFGQGPTEGSGGESVVSDLSGAFTLAHGEVAFERLSFSVPGFAVQLTGTYGLESERLDLAGRVLVMRAPSDMGPQRMAGLLAIADQLLAPAPGRRGFAVPISITGSRSKPTFKVDAGALRRDLGRTLGQNLGTLGGANPRRPPP